MSVKEANLRGKSDDEVFAYAVARGRILITRDLDFSDVHRFRLGSHPGLIVIRLPIETSRTVVAEILAMRLKKLSDADLLGNLVVLSSASVRIRTLRD